jgi:hypothetical protein
MIWIIIFNFQVISNNLRKNSNNLRFKSYDHIESINFFEKIHQYGSTKNPDDFRIFSLNQIVIKVEKPFIDLYNIN